MMRDLQMSDKAMKLCKKIGACDAADRWHFDLPLALRLHKTQRSCRRWLASAKSLVDKSPLRAMAGQTTLNAHFMLLLSPRNVVN